MIDLVLWSFTITLTPLALGLGLRLLKSADDRLRFGPTRNFGPAHAVRTLRAEPRCYGIPSAPRCVRRPRAS